MRFQLLAVVKKFLSYSSCVCKGSSPGFGKSIARSNNTERRIIIFASCGNGSISCTANNKFRFFSIVAHQTEINSSPLILEELLITKPHPKVSEREYYRSHLKSLPEYKKTFFNPNEESYEVTTCVSNFVREAKGVDKPFVTDARYDSVVNDVLSNVEKLSQEELLTILYYLGKFPLIYDVREAKFMKIWKTLDAACLRQKMNYDRVLQFNDLFYKLRISRLSLSHWIGVKKGLRKLEASSKEQFVRLMFCLISVSKIPESINTYPIEFNLKRHIECMSTEEIGLSLVAIRKLSKNIINKQLVQRLLEIVAQNSKSVSSYAVASVSRITQSSSHFKIAPAIYSFQEKMIAEIDRFSNTYAIELGLVSSTVGYPNREMIKKLLTKINDSNISDLTLGDLSKLCQLMVLYGVRCQELEQKLIADLQNPSREREFQLPNYAVHLPDIVHHLSINEIFQEDLFAKVLSPEFLKICYDNVMYRFKPELMLVDLTAEIELPNYKGPRLTIKQQGYLLKRNMFWLDWLSLPPKKSEPEYKRVVRSVVETTELFLGCKKQHFATNVLPQYALADVVFCIDSTGKFTEIPQSYYDANQEHLVKRIPDSADTKNKQFHVLMVISRNSCYYNSKEIRGATNMQIRQITKLGYTIHKVFACDWTDLVDQSQKLNHLSEILVNFNYQLNSQIE